jgi:hypothetical protein
MRNGQQDSSDRERIAKLEERMNAIVAEGILRENHSKASYENLVKIFEEKHVENKDYNEKILKQVTATNGRMTALEAWKNHVEGAKAAVSTMANGSKWFLGGTCIVIGWILNPLIESSVKALLHLK